MYDELTGQIIGATMRVHSRLGPGFFERVYEECLVLELARAGLPVERQLLAPVQYDGVRIELGYRLDLVVNHNVIIELKTVSRLQKGRNQTHNEIGSQRPYSITLCNLVTPFSALALLRPPPVSLVGCTFTD